jgi:hypothetical protein
MPKNKLKIEIYEGDPFTGCCGPGLFSVDAAERLRKMLMERNATVKALKEEFKEQVEIERDIVSNRRRCDTYPPYISKLLLAGVRVPFIVIDGQLALEGVFPSIEDFRNLISKHVNRLQVDKCE